MGPRLGSRLLIDDCAIHSVRRLVPLRTTLTFTLDMCGASKMDNGQLTNVETTTLTQRKKPPVKHSLGQPLSSQGDVCVWWRAYGPSTDSTAPDTTVVMVVTQIKKGATEISSVGSAVMRASVACPTTECVV